MPSAFSVASTGVETSVPSVAVTVTPVASGCALPVTRTSLPLPPLAAVTMLWP